MDNNALSPRDFIELVKTCRNVLTFIAQSDDDGARMQRCMLFAQALQQMVDATMIIMATETDEQRQLFLASLNDGIAQMEASHNMDMMARSGYYNPNNKGEA